MARFAWWKFPVAARWRVDYKGQEHRAETKVGINGQGNRHRAGSPSAPSPPSRPACSFRRRIQIPVRAKWHNNTLGYLKTNC